LGWVGSNFSYVLKNSQLELESIDGLGWVGLKSFKWQMGWVGFKNFGLGWVGFSKSDPRPTLIHIRSAAFSGEATLSASRDAQSACTAYREIRLAATEYR
jgi:hypothetical protein